MGVSVLISSLPITVPGAGWKASQGHTDQKAMKPPHPTPTSPQPLSSIRPVPFHLHREIRTQTHEYEERNDLKRQTGNHDVDPILSLRRVAPRRRIGQRSTRGLQHQREDVCGNEDDGVGPRFEARELLAIEDDDAGEAEVDTCGEETGCYG